MDKVETLQEPYKRKLDWIPDNLKNEIWHFNLFRLEPLVEGKPTHTHCLVALAAHIQRQSKSVLSVV